MVTRGARRSRQEAAQALTSVVPAYDDGLDAVLATAAAALRADGRDHDDDLNDPMGGPWLLSWLLSWRARGRSRQPWRR